jgi:hypothetical protein
MPERSHVAQPIASVEAVLELSQVAGDVFRPNGMVGCRHAVREVCQQSVGPLKGGVLNRLFAGPGDHRLMTATDILNPHDAAQAVGIHGTARS